MCTPAVSVRYGVRLCGKGHNKPSLQLHRQRHRARPSARNRSNVEIHIENMTCSTAVRKGTPGPRKICTAYTADTCTRSRNSCCRAPRARTAAARRTCAGEEVAVHTQWQCVPTLNLGPTLPHDPDLRPDPSLWPSWDEPGVVRETQLGWGWDGAWSPPGRAVAACGLGARALVTARHTPPLALLGELSA